MFTGFFGQMHYVESGTFAPVKYNEYHSQHNLGFFRRDYPIATDFFLCAHQYVTYMI